MKTVASAAKELGISIAKLQELAKRAGVPATGGATRIREPQFTMIRRELAKERAADQQLRQLGSTTVRLQGRGGLRPASKPKQRQECCCCRITLAMGLTGTGTQLCAACRSHYQIPDEPTSRLIERLSDHERRMTEGFLKAREFADIAVTQRNYAYRSRDQWRGVAVKLILDHEDNGNGCCVECGASFPCPVWKRLEKLNIGCYRETEKVAGFSDEELDHYLFPARSSEAHYRDAGFYDDQGTSRDSA